MWLLFQWWMQSWRRGEWSWKTSTHCLYMKLSWWFALLVGAGMGQQFILKLSPSVGIILFQWLCRNMTERSRQFVFSHLIFHSACVFSLLRYGCCCDYCNCFWCWAVIDDYFSCHDLFLQPQKVRPYMHFVELQSFDVIYSQYILFYLLLLLFFQAEGAFLASCSRSCK